MLLLHLFSSTYHPVLSCHVLIYTNKLAAVHLRNKLFILYSTLLIYRPRIYVCSLPTHLFTLLSLLSMKLPYFMFLLYPISPTYQSSSASCSLTLSFSLTSFSTSLLTNKPIVAFIQKRAGCICSPHVSVSVAAASDRGKRPGAQRPTVPRRER